MLKTTYPSPEELMESCWEHEAVFSSLLFKLGMTVVDVWGVYNQIINQIYDIGNDNSLKTA